MGLGYGELIAFALVALLVVAVVFAAYRWGVARERARTLKLISESERRVFTAVDEGRRDPVRVDDAWLHRGTCDTGAGGALPAPPGASGR